ncbi:hypothetical protein JADG_010513 [Aureobasidium aubasidani]|nr:hypothetical protein JADG_010513 [Aureobasidium pullulans]
MLTTHFTSNFMEPYDGTKPQYLKTFNKYTIGSCYYNEYRKWPRCAENNVNEVNDSTSGDSADVAHLDEHSAIVHQTDTPVFGVDRRVHQKTTGLANQNHSENEQHTTTPGS